MANTVLRRYTEIPALIYLLTERTLTLLDPATWDDSNDSHYLSLYREKKKLGSVLAACFSQIDETYHHWRVFAGSSSGVCIKFNRATLLEHVSKQQGVRYREVTYLKLSQIRPRQMRVDELPFLKRFAFEHEAEFRIVYESAARITKLDIPISIKAIERVTLSPWIHPDLYSDLKALVRRIRVAAVSALPAQSSLTMRNGSRPAKKRNRNRSGANQWSSQMPYVLFLKLHLNKLLA